MTRIWGLAAGRGSTDGCARGALTARDYPTRKAAEEASADWNVILYVTETEIKDK
jgi:hypothetical protein